MKLFLDDTQWFDTSKPLDISYPISNTSQNNNAWYCPSPVIEPVRTEEFLGSVKEGGNVNFRNIFFNPHGNGTHTECVGHISEEVYSLNQRLSEFFFHALLISVSPKHHEGFPAEDLVIGKAELKDQIADQSPEALVIRTLPNTDKTEKDYSNTNPPYLTEEAMHFIVEKNIQHLLIDLPSVDREFDEGKLSAHHIFWNYPEDKNSTKTITELIVIPNEIQDGNYVLNLMVAPFVNDASPSKPVIYEVFRS